MEIEDVLKRALADPREALRQLDKLDSERSLLAFIRFSWAVLEPGRKFVSGWAVDAICEHLEAVSSGQIRRLLINVPPGCMKSLTTNVFWPAWEWGPRNRPDMRYISASYSEALTVRDNRRCRMLILSRAYQALWGDSFKLVGDQNAKVRYDTNHTGFKIATSVGGLGTGERADRFIVDDPHNVKEAESEAKREGALQWFAEVVPTRVTDPEKAAIVVIMQRVHERDVSGLILKSGLGYEVLSLPMEHEVARTCVTKIGFQDPRTVEGELLWPERFSRRHLEEDLKPALRSWGGTYAEAGQLQQRPAPRGGGLFLKASLRVVDEAPKCLKVVRGWDLAMTDDGHAAWTVGVKMGRDQRKQYWILDVVRFRGQPGEVEQKIKTTADTDGHTVTQDLPQDPGQAGKAQKRYIAAELAGHDVHFSPETGSKEDRARPLASQAEAGNVFLLRGAWNDVFISEATLFPNGEFKDQIDAASRAFSRIVMQREQKVGAAPTTIGG